MLNHFAHLWSNEIGSQTQKGTAEWHEKANIRRGMLMLLMACIFWMVDFTKTNIIFEVLWFDIEVKSFSIKTCKALNAQWWWTERGMRESEREREHSNIRWNAIACALSIHINLLKYYYDDFFYYVFMYVYILVYPIEHDLAHIAAKHSYCGSMQRINHIFMTCSYTFDIIGHMQRLFRSAHLNFLIYILDIIIYDTDLKRNGPNFQWKWCATNILGSVRMNRLK